MSGIFFVVVTGEGGCDCHLEVKDVAKHPAIHSIMISIFSLFYYPLNKDLLSPKYQ